MYIIFLIISGILCSLPFINFSLFPLAWVSLVPFFIALYKSKNDKESVLFGFVFGIFFFGITLYWITELRHFVSLWAYLGWIAVTLFQSLFIVVFSFILYRFVISRPSKYKGMWSFLWVLAPAVIWTLFEWLRSLGPYGITGGGLGYSQALFIPLIQIASFTGVYGISFIIVLFNTALTPLFIEQGSILERFKKQLLTTIAILILIFLVCFYGIVKVNISPPHPEVNGLRIAIIQANIPQKEKLDYGLVNKIFDTHLKLSHEILPAKPQVIIWPETAITDYLMENAVLLSRLKKFTFKNSCHLIVGAPYFSQDGKIFNSLIAFSPKGNVIQRYDKKHLVPFGEYLPLRPLFYPLLKHTGNLFEEDFDSNPDVKPLPVKDYISAATICFESTFPYIVRKRLKHGGDFILVVTNDAWFGDSPAAKQHFYSGVFRAIENGSYLVQVANTGISGVVDPFGRILKKTKLGERTAFIVKVNKRSKETFYLRYGDLFVYLCLIIVSILVLQSFTRLGRPSYRK